MPQVDLNCDMGESFGVYTIGMDEQVIRHITSANIACGFHAGDPRVLDRTVKLAADFGVAVGAHPGFPDLQGFGRRSMECTLDEIRAYVVYQIGAVQAFCSVHGVKLQHVKAHGSLYNMSVKDGGIARAIVEGVAMVDESLILVTLAGKSAELMERIGAEVGLRIAFEAFPDRAYTPEGVLADRRLPGALIEDVAEVAQRAVRMVTEGRVLAMDGTPLPVRVHTLCVHGDSPGALDAVTRIREVLEKEAVEVLPMGRILF